MYCIGLGSGTSWVQFVRARSCNCHSRLRGSSTVDRRDIWRREVAHILFRGKGDDVHKQNKFWVRHGNKQARESPYGRIVCSLELRNGYIKFINGKWFGLA